VRSGAATWLGIAAILVWSTNSTATITLVRHLGPLTALALVCALAGGALAIVEDVRLRRPGAFLRVGLPFGLLGGACFVLYQVLYFTAFSLAAPAMAAPLNLVNYLWPSLTVLLCIARARRSLQLRPTALLGGLALGLAGIAIAVAPEPAGLIATVRGSPLAFLAMLGAAVAWAAYSALAVPLHRPGAPSGTPLFFLLVAVTATVMRFASGEQSTLTAGDWPLLAYSVIAPSAGAYLMWELAMRSGDVPLLGALSNALPLLSTLVLWLVLGAPGGGMLGLGAVLVGVGALLVHRGARPRETAQI
jgi:drug/metabolite transporter (DMT)-like permease